MKKTLFCILTLTLLLTLGLLTCTAEEEKNVTCYVGEITVDGEIDEIWEQVEPIYVENLKTGEYMNDPDKTFQDYARMQCKVLWDSEWTLYILYEVIDPVICLDGPEEWDRDSVEFFIDEDNERAGAFDSNSTQWRTLAVEGILEYPHQRVATQAVRYTAEGYIVELAYEFMLLDPFEGHVIGFDLQVNDDAEGNGKRHACLGWSDIDDSASSDNTVWGTLTFSEKRADGKDAETEEVTTEAPTEAPTEEPTEAPTEAPTEPVTEAPTEAPTIQQTPTETDATKGGCGSALDVSAIWIFSLCALAVGIRCLIMLAINLKKKEN
ncbi:MAG: hypothetical protein IJD38_07565 [Clostridia bacterium]|nr:hypothetical protein [Clostridia bacterium]